MRVRTLSIAVAVAAILAFTPGPADGATYKRTRVVRGIVHFDSDWKGTSSGSASAVKCTWETNAERVQGFFGWVLPLSQREGNGSHYFRLRLDGDVTGYLRIVFFGRTSACTTPANLGSARTLFECREVQCRFGEAKGRIPKRAAYAVITGGSEATPSITYSLIPFPTCWNCDIRPRPFTLFVAQRLRR